MLHPIPQALFIESPAFLWPHHHNVKTPGSQLVIAVPRVTSWGKHCARVIQSMPLIQQVLTEGISHAKWICDFGIDLWSVRGMWKEVWVKLDFFLDLLTPGEVPLCQAFSHIFFHSKAGRWQLSHFTKGQRHDHHQSFFKPPLLPRMSFSPLAAVSYLSSSIWVNSLRLQILLILLVHVLTFQLDWISRSQGSCWYLIVSPGSSPEMTTRGVPFQLVTVCKEAQWHGDVADFGHSPNFSPLPESSLWPLDFTESVSSPISLDSSCALLW